MRARGRRVLSGLAATASLLALTACGGGGSDTAQAAGTSPAPTGSAVSGDEAAIVKVATEVVTSGGSGRTCDELLTPGFVTAVFGDLASCKDSAGEEGNATSAKVTSVVINGDTASATVADEGGSASGATGVWRFSRAADGWRVSEWSIDYIRSAISALFGKNYESEGSGDPFADAKVRTCFVNELQAREDQEFRALFYAVLQERFEEIEKPILKCVGQASNSAQAPNRRLFEIASRDQLGEFLTPKQVDCVIERLRKTVTDKDIVDANTKDSAALKIYQASEAAALQCGAGKADANAAAKAARPKGKPAAPTR